MEISKDWDENVRLQWEASIKHIEEGIGEQFGALNLQHKIERFKKIGPKPFSIISYHNNLLTDIRNAYVLGSFYSSLTGTCALGERILNHLILDLREYYKPKYNFWKDIWNIIYKNNKFDIYTCKTCSSWALMINTLLGWKVFSEETASLFKKLSKKRHKSLHFNIDTVQNLEEESLESIDILQEIVKKQFSAFGGDYFIYSPGEAFLKKELENKPFFKEYYIPSCKLVSPYHKMIQIIPSVIIEDIEVEHKEISDDEFIRLRNEFKENNVATKGIS